MHGLRWRTAHASSIDEKGLIYIFKATSAPPRAGTTGIIPSRYTSKSTSGVAQGGGGSFNHGTPWERRVVATHGWQSESTDDPKGG